MVPSYELWQKKPKVDKFNSKVWQNKDCDEHFDKLIKETNLTMATHKGMTVAKKLKDINEEIKGNSQR
jgi:hypothetical protein